ncbi:hypothetical protein GP486_000843 [Trichoglossum hirsutum]|uniref:Uncharacterized protein n=1 Tax=Trichoglossum hirsutum TaxID=265104 RepID=A0A9P8RTN9_9PEZI|nr:hypothetical protein GP486_000843 [Trichoglossum hirsutum]
MSANNRLDKGKRSGKDRDIELHAASQRTPREEELSCGFPQSQDAGRRTLSSEDLSDRETYKTSGNTLLAHLTSERASPSPLGLVSTPKPAFVSHKNNPEPAARPDGDAASEMTDKFTWSASARPAAPLDGSTNGDWPSSPCHPIPKAVVDMEQVNHGNPLDFAADPQRPAHGRCNQDGGSTHQEERQPMSVKNHSGIDYREARMDFKSAQSTEAPIGGSEQLISAISAIEGQLMSRIPASLWSRTDRGASRKQPALDSDNHNIKAKSKDQPSPCPSAISRDRETVPRAPSPEDSAEVFPTVSASCSVHIGQTIKPPAGLVVSASAPIGTNPDTHQARPIARPKHHPSDTTLDEILFLNPPRIWLRSHQHDECNCYSSRGASELRQSEAGTLGRLRSPSPHVSRADATRWSLPPSCRGCLEETNSGAFYASSPKQHRPQTRSNTDRGIAQPGAQGGSILTTNFKSSGENLRPRSSIALGPADVDIEEFNRYQHNRNQDMVSKALRIRSPGNIPGNIASVSSVGESLNVSQVDPNRLETHGFTHGNHGSFQRKYPAKEDPLVENKSHGTYETSRNQGQSFHDNSAIQRKNVLQIQSEKINGISMATFWRPHKLY